MSPGPQRQQNRRDEEHDRRGGNAPPPADSHGGGSRRDLHQGNGNHLRDDHQTVAPQQRRPRRFFGPEPPDQGQHEQNRTRTGESTGQPPGGTQTRERHGGGARPGQGSEPPGGPREQRTHGERPNGGEGRPAPTGERPTPATERPAPHREQHQERGDGPAPGRPRGASPEGSAEPLRPQRYVDGWSAGSPEQWERRHGAHRQEQGEGHTPATGGRPQQAGDAGAPQGRSPDKMSSQEALDGLRIPSFQLLHERQWSGSHDRTGGLKQTEHEHGGQGHTSQPQTDFSSSISGYHDKPSSSPHDNKPPTDSGTGGNRP